MINYSQLKENYELVVILKMLVKNIVKEICVKFSFVLNNKMVRVVVFCCDESLISYFNMIIMALGDNMERQIKTILIDGLVLLKIIKHCQDEIIQPQDVVTHSFLIPKAPEDTESGDISAFDCFVSTYPTLMFRRLRDVNVDYMEIGLCQSSNNGAFLIKIFLKNLYYYHKNLNESMKFIYDPSESKSSMDQMKHVNGRSMSSELA